eukprot:Rmarinus@m.20365
MASPLRDISNVQVLTPSKVHHTMLIGELDRAKGLLSGLGLCAKQQTQLVAVQKETTKVLRVKMMENKRLREDLQKTKSERDQALDENDKLSEVYEKLVQEYERVSENDFQSTTRLSQVDKELFQSRSELVDTVEKLETMTSRAEEAESEVNRLQSSLTESLTKECVRSAIQGALLTAEKQRCEAVVKRIRLDAAASLKERDIRWTTRVQELEEQLAAEVCRGDELNNFAALEQGAFTELENESSTLREELEKTQTELEEFKSRCEKATENVESLEFQLQTVTNTHEAELTTLRDEIASLREETRDWRTRAEVAEPELERLRQDSENSISSSDNAELELHSLRTSNASLEEERTTLSARVHELEAQLLDVDSSQTSSEETMRVSETCLVQLRKDLQEAVKQRDEVQALNSSLEKEKRSLQSWVQDLQTKLESVSAGHEKQMARALANVKSAQKERSVALVATQSLKDQMTRQASEFERRVSDRVKEERQRARRLESELAACEKQLREMKKQTPSEDVQQLKTRTVKYRETITKLEDRVRELSFNGTLLEADNKQLMLQLEMALDDKPREILDSLHAERALSKEKMRCKKLIEENAELKKLNDVSTATLRSLRQDLLPNKNHSDSRGSYSEPSPTSAHATTHTDQDSCSHHNEGNMSMDLQDEDVE